MEEKQRAVIEKECSSCHMVRSEFYANKNTKDGLSGECKECAKTRTKRNRAAKLEYYKEYDRQRNRLPHRLEKHRQYVQTDAGKDAMDRGRKKFRASERGKEIERIGQKRRMAQTPEKHKARMAIINAVRDGKIERRPCEECGAPNAQAHHHDYAKPFEVRWLCPKHHSDEHRRINKEQNARRAA